MSSEALRSPWRQDRPLLATRRIVSDPFGRVKARVPIFTEKPIAGSIEMGEKIINALKASGTFMMIGYHKRSDPATMYVKKEIAALKQSGELGKLRYVRVVMPSQEPVLRSLGRIGAGCDFPRPALGKALSDSSQ